MTGNSVAERTIARGVAAAGFVRRHRPLSRRAKEWLHFCVAGDTVSAFVNFSLSCEPRSPEVARLTCAVHDGAWDGEVVTFGERAVRVSPGRLDLAFGDSSVGLRADGQIELRVEIPRRLIRIQLTLRPGCLPLVVNNVHAGGDSLLHWFLLPRVFASGEIRCGERIHRIESAPAYHDHNWGNFGWGSDFAWVWGYAHPSSPAVPWSFTFDRFMNRARTADRALALLLWKGARQHRTFRDRELAVDCVGMLRKKPSLQLPRPMALLRPERASDVPERLRVRAESLGDTVELEISCRSFCQILIPNDVDLGVTVLNEVTCVAELEGKVGGERVSLSGHGMLELLGN